MGYMHIDNLYKNQKMLIFRDVYELEKIHGTSAHVSFRAEDNEVKFFSGGASHAMFVVLFPSQEHFVEKFKALGHEQVTVYGEAYGGKLQKMKDTYGPDLRFVAFDVKIGETWLNVPNAEDVCNKLGIEFVAYSQIVNDVEILNACRDQPSRQAIRNGITEPRMSEGIIIRPVYELKDNQGNRFIAKHKRPEFSERKSKADTEIDPEKVKILRKAQDIADEWVTPMRLEHVLDKFKASNQDLAPEITPQVIRSMLEDIYREAKDEIVESKESNKAIGTATAKMFKKWLQDQLQDA